MLVLGDEALQNPTLVERKVKDQIAQRLLEHEQRNEARKKPREEKQAKNISKWAKKDETSVRLTVAAFKVSGNLEDKRHQYKVRKNAEQLWLSGCCLLCSKDMGQSSLVVVEGLNMCIIFRQIFFFV